MLRRKYEFKPDRRDSGMLNKLYITKKQRLSLLRWLLIGLVLLALSLVQDVVISQLRPFGTVTDLVPGGILLCCMLLGVEQSAVFALCASTAYCFSGFAPGIYSILLLTALSIVFNIFRHSYLRRSILSVLFCAGLALMLYEVAVFFIALFMERTLFARFGVVLLGGLLTVAVLPAIYPLFLSVTKIGGESWKE